MNQPAETPVVAVASPVADRARTHIASCPGCGADAAEPIGVTGAMDNVLAAVLAMRCSECSSVYLSPAPDADCHAAPPAELTRRRVRDWTRGLSGTARILVAACDDGPLLRAFARNRPGHRKPAGMRCAAATADMCRASGCSFAAESILELPVPDASNRYELVILPHSLESAVRPEALLCHVRSLLADNGRVVSITANPESSCFRLFGGRHWSAYRYPHTRQHLSAPALKHLCARAGLLVARCSTLYASREWLISLANCLHDWDAPRILGAAVTGQWGIPQAAASVIETLALLHNRGSLLAAELVKR